jgi:LemA protein
MIDMILIGVGVVVLIGIVLSYNDLVTLRNRVDNALSQIDVQLKKRADLVPNLVETVKGYVKHEKGTLENITKARSALLKAQSVKEKAKAENMLSGALKTLFAVSENYPKLRANENFLMLQEELSGIENKIAYARQFYNDSVVTYNTKIQLVPTNIIANLFSFKEREYFEATETEKKNVKVKF